MRQDPISKLSWIRSKLSIIHPVSQLTARFNTINCRNFNYPNPTLNPNQTFPILLSPVHPSTETDIPPLSITPSRPTKYTSSQAPIHFDLQTATSPPTDENLVPTEINQTILLYIKTQKLAIYSNHPMGFINRTSWHPQSPPLISLPRSYWNSHQLVPHIPLPSSPLWVDIILNNLDDGSHPFHLHGHSFYILATHRSDHGWGSYNPWSETASNLAVEPVLNVKNPVRKDTVSVPRRGYAVIRFRADNEGVWMLHCHVLVHLGSGMAMGVQVAGGGDGVVDDGAGGLCG
jgi:FtsP/CotA-like multicopper oxidase with cupredoxin domain